MENNENQFILKSASQCITLIEYARKYLKESEYLIDYKIKSAVLIDSINYFSLIKGYDLLLTINNLYNIKINKISIDVNELIKDVFNIYSKYIFEEGIVDSVLLNCYSNTLTEKFNEVDGIKVLIDFINYICKTNNIYRIFTLRELSEHYERQKYIKEMEELKSFLNCAYEYYDRLSNGETIEEVYKEMCIENELKNISLTGSYNYTIEARKKYGRCQMYPWNKIAVNNQLYAMSYAYAKMYGGNKHSLKIKPIKQKINEMKK